MGAPTFYCGHPYLTHFEWVLNLSKITYQSFLSFLFLSLFFNSFDELRLCDDKYSVDILVVVTRSPTVKDKDFEFCTQVNHGLLLDAYQRTVKCAHVHSTRFSFSYLMCSSRCRKNTVEFVRLKSTQSNQLDPEHAANYIHTDSWSSFNGL